mmetsp:Transcript_25244/g.45707  ORF Transcript_25244/g.45707 Transcript_25244/m.45707 type:complete len:319 (-) Transcript_25244:592-1548(-)
MELSDTMIHHRMGKELETTPPKRKAKAAGVKFIKAPQAPKRFKSAYMFFSTAMHPEIRTRLGSKGTKEKTTIIAKLVSIEWKGLNEEERARWEEMARLDKERFLREKSTYSGPWKVQIRKKDASTPKRPMSAFLDFSNENRKLAQLSNPHLNSRVISKILANMWKEAQADERAFFVDRERERVETFRAKLKAWKEREHHTAVVTQTDVPFHPRHHEENPPFHQNETALVGAPVHCHPEADDIYLKIPADAGNSMNWEPRAVFREDFYHENMSKLGMGTFETMHSSSNHPGNGEQVQYMIQGGSIFVYNPDDERLYFCG